MKMENNKDDMFVGVNNLGEEQVFYKLFEFDSNETGKHYLAYTDKSQDEKGNTRVYGSVMIQDGELIKLEPIATEKEWKVIEITLNALQSQGKEDKNE